MLEDALQDREAERLFNKLRLCIRELEGLPTDELVAQARKLTRHIA